LKSFKIEKSRVKLSYCHPGVFVPVYDKDKYAFTTSSGKHIAYWDEHGFASEWRQPGKEGTPPNPHKAYALPMSYRC